MEKILQSHNNERLIKNIKIKAFVFIVLWIIGQIITLLSFASKYNNGILIILDNVILLVTIISLIILTISVQRTSQSKNLLQNLLIAHIIAPLVALLCSCIYLYIVDDYNKIISAILEYTYCVKSGGDVCDMLYIKVFVVMRKVVNIFSAILLCIFLIYAYRYFRELAFVTNQRLFIIAFWCAILLAPLSFFMNTRSLLALRFVLIPSFIMFIIAWIRFKEIRISQINSSKIKVPKIETLLICAIIILLLIFVVLLLNAINA